ncbi:hypothetical protein MPSEU_000442400 [Mayamaea pseudoterrestris]|nr:hypothetical protein MPSEU_000442400 [Mayamaea pseudoterrestris]
MRDELQSIVITIIQSKGRLHLVDLYSINNPTNESCRTKKEKTVQINVANVDPTTGLATGDSTAYCLAGYIRFKSEADMAMTSLVQKKDAELFGLAQE